MIDNRKVLAYLHDETKYKSTRRLNRNAKLHFVSVGSVVSNKWEGWATSVTDNYTIIETEKGYYIPINVATLGSFCSFRDDTPINEAGLSNRGVKKGVDARGNVVYTSDEPVNIKIKSNVKCAAIHVPAFIILPYGSKYGCPIVVNNPKIPVHTKDKIPVGDYIVCNTVNGRLDFNSAMLINGGIFCSDFETTRFTEKAVAESDAEFLKAVTVRDRYNY